MDGVSEPAQPDTATADEVAPAGHFRIYLGAAPGGGKTYAMLSEGRRRRDRGADVVAGFVESYGRPRTEDLLNGFEIIPRKAVEYRGTRLEEMDLDAVLRRRPEVVLVDELAHTNVPGSGPHDKRWQDVQVFRTGNLIALRELALRFVADESDEQLLGHLKQHRPPVPWETTERIMVAVTPAPGTDATLRRAARIALRCKADLEVVHVIIDGTGLSGDLRSIDGLRQLAADLGAHWNEIQQDDPAPAIVDFARQHEITQILIGPVRGWHVAVGGPIVRRVIEEAGASGIDVLIIGRHEAPE
jgi:K+-sensing histidine kinase KdpD